MHDPLRGSVWRCLFNTQSPFSALVGLCVIKICEAQTVTAWNWAIFITFFHAAVPPSFRGISTIQSRTENSWTKSWFHRVVSLLCVKHDCVHYPWFHFPYGGIHPCHNAWHTLPSFKPWQYWHRVRSWAQLNILRRIRLTEIGAKGVD